MSDNVEQAARELLRLQAELEDLEARIKEQKRQGVLGALHPTAEVAQAEAAPRRNDRLRPRRLRLALPHLQHRRHREDTRRRQPITANRQQTRGHRR